jgi:sugar/nucleoside kinase (ribokinase family)
MQFPLKPPAGKLFDAVGFGLNAVDHLIVVPEYPAFDTKMRLLDHKQSAGGQTASAMVALRRLGFKTAYSGRFGSDQAGLFGFQTLKDDDVNVDFAQIVEGARNQIAFITIDARSGERTIVWDRDERLAYKRDEAPAEFGALGKVLHLDAHDPPACVAVAKAARDTGTIVSADIDNVYEGLPELLPLIDIMIGSKEFPRRVTGVADPRAALVELKNRFGCALVGMTIGAAGAVVYHEGSFIESPGFEAPGGCKDTTGAGDAFHAGFLCGFLSGEDIETSLKLGNAVAAIKCSALGARTALPTKPELNAFLTPSTEL